MWYIRASAFTNTHHSSSNYLFKPLPGPTLTPSPGSPSRLRCCQPRDLSIPWILTAHSLLVFITLETFFILPFLKKLFTFSWGIIALQGCVGFCHTSTWISHRYTHIPSRQTFVGKAMSLLFNTLSRLAITFFPRSKRLLISWLQSPSALHIR